MIWSEVQITTTPEAEDAIAELFYEEGANGVAIENSIEIENLWDNPLVDFVDESLLNRPENTSLIRGYFPNDEDSEKRIQNILYKISQLPKYGLKPGTAELKILEVEDQDWENSWKKYFFATNVTDKFVVVPTWDKYKPTDGEVIIKLDPGMAFGTGTHETTRLCADLLEKYFDKNDTIIDVGTGSGILAIIAALLGAKEVIGIDFDPVAVKVAKENITKNELEEKVEILEGDLLSLIDQNIRANIIVANILPEPIIRLIPQTIDILKENGILILSGIIQEALAEVIEVLEENSFSITEVKSLGDWRAIAATKL